MASRRPFAALARVLSRVALALLGCAPLAPAEGGLAPRAADELTAPVDELEFGCARAVMDRDSVYRMPLAGAEQDPELAAELSILPYRARRVALAAGLEPLLARLLRERRAALAAPAAAEPAPAHSSVALLAREYELGARLSAFDAQLTAAAFEAHCTGRALQRLLLELGQAEQSRQLSLAVASLVSGAVLGTASSVWGLADDASDGPAILGIVAGLTTTGLGAAMLVHVERSLPYRHRRNRLTPIWQGRDPDHLYSSFVFHMLTSADADRDAPLGVTLVESWRRQLEGLPEAQRANAQRLLFGDGGLYSELTLALRAEMFENVESAVQGVARDVELLERYLVRVLTDAAPGSSSRRPPALDVLALDAQPPDIQPLRRR